MKIVGTALVLDDENRILIGQRPEGKALAGLWEFPGGKQEIGETIEECISRELREELDVEVDIGKFVMEVTHSYEHGEFKLMVYEAKIKDISVMKANVHQDLKWVKVSELDSYEFPIADKDIVIYLKEHY